MIGFEEDYEEEYVKPKSPPKISPNSYNNNCLNYKNTLNLPCERRDFPTDLSSIDYTPHDMHNYINKYFTQQNPLYNNGSPFVFKEDYKNKDMDDLCKSESLELNEIQKFLGMYVNYLTNINGVLLYHSMGSGKSCSSIIISEANKFAYIDNKSNKLKPRFNTNEAFLIYVVLPKNVKEQYENEIKGSLERGCTNSCVINESEQTYYGNKKNVELIYKITTHDKFLNDIFYVDPETKHYSPTQSLNNDIFHKPNTLLIIDEIHTIIREFTPYTTTKYKKLYYFLNYYARIRESGKPAMKVVLLTGTPIYDNPFQAGLIINLLRPRIPFPITRNKFNEFFIDKNKNVIKNKLLFQYMSSGYISYFKGGNPNAFPYRKNFFIETKMSEQQEESYAHILEYELKKMKMEETKSPMDNDKEIDESEEDELKSYFVKSREESNIFFNHVSNNTNDNFMHFFEELNKTKNVNSFLKRHSPKLLKIVELASKSPGPVFIYSKFVNHGILSIAAILIKLGWNLFSQEKDSSAPTFGVWSPTALSSLSLINLKNITSDKDQSNYTSTLKEAFNSNYNADGSICKIIISSVTEGISLKRVSQVHICEPWWNNSEIEQIVTRGIRFCSHKDTENKEVEVYYHISKLCSILNIKNNKRFSENSIDQIVYATSFRKNKLNIQFEKTLKEVAIDCSINKYGNIIRLEEIYFPELPPLFYDRTNNIFYVISPDKQFLIKVLISETEFPPKSFGIERHKIPFNPIFYENVKCFNTDKNFVQLKKYAIEKQEDPNAWNYFHNLYIMNTLLPNIISEYKIFEGNVSKTLTNHLYKILLEPKKYDLSDKHIKNIQKFIFSKKIFIPKKKSMINFLMSKNISIDKLNNAQLEYKFNKYFYIDKLLKLGYKSKDIKNMTIKQMNEILQNKYPISFA